MRDFSQQGEGRWVLDTLEYKDGTFVDIGCGASFLFKYCVLEMEYGWRGVGVDMEPYSGPYYDHYKKIGSYPQDILDDPKLQTWETRKKY